MKREEGFYLWHTRANDARSPLRHTRSPFLRGGGQRPRDLVFRGYASGGRGGHHRSFVRSEDGSQEQMVHLLPGDHECGFMSSSDAECETMPDSALLKNIHGLSHPRVA